jgi:hypothetical protein
MYSKSAQFQFVKSAQMLSVVLAVLTNFISYKYP